MNNYVRFLVAFVFCAWPTRPAVANIALTTDAESTPLEVQAGGPTVTFTVSTFSDGSDPQKMSGWQFEILLAPLSGAGTLTFDLPISTTAPSNYVFATDSIAISSETELSFIAQDDVSVANAVAIPTTGKNLLEVPVHAEANASGTFGIFVQQGQFSTVWLDENLDELAFGNVPFGAGTVQIGTINVTAVPEARAWLCMLVVAGALSALSFQFRHR